MMRIQIVLVLMALLVIGNLAYRRRVAAMQTHRGSELLPAELRGPGTTWVVFTTPTCATCGPVLTALRSTQPDATVTAIDATQRPDLSDALGVRSAPTVVRADANGTIDLRLAGPAATSDFFALRTA